MPKRFIEIGSALPLLDIASYARRGPGQRDRLSRDEIELIARTVHRVPEVMVKVLTRGGQDLRAVGRHFAYLSRKGELEIETDDGQGIRGKGSEGELVEDWDLDIQEQRPTSALQARSSGQTPRPVHKLLFSMPPGTPPEKVLKAVKVFAREEFGLQHRYAMVLHTDESHPHVHMVVKAVSEGGVRLNIRKGTLRDWRRKFAQQLRATGVEANATERAVRGEIKAPMRDAHYRAGLRNDCRWSNERVEAVRRMVRAGSLSEDYGFRELRKTRDQTERGWWAVGELILRQGDSRLARDIIRFTEQMLPPLTDKQQIARALMEFSRASGRAR
jgi:hypothetical protein